MENPFYRSMIERLNALFGDRAILKKADIAAFENVSESTVSRRYDFIDCKGIEVTAYAKIVSARQWAKLPDVTKREIRKSETV